VEVEREERVGLKAVLRERMVCEGVRRGAKVPEKRLLRVDMLVVVVVVGGDVVVAVDLFRAAVRSLLRGVVQRWRESEAF
jgi:hypothetical protein